MLLYSIPFVIWDVVWGKIPNLWLIFGLVFRLLQHLCGMGEIGRLQIEQTVLCVCFLFPFYLKGGIGAGDVKLFCLMALWIPPERFCEWIIWELILLGATALVVGFRFGYQSKKEIRLAPLLCLGAVFAIFV